MGGGSKGLWFFAEARGGGKSINYSSWTRNMYLRKKGFESFYIFLEGRVII